MSSKLAETLLRLARNLDATELRWAVVGGLAASARGEARFTRDVDVAIAVTGDDEAERCLFALRSAGYVVLTTVEQEATGRLATARLRDPSGVPCDLIFATCGVEAEIVQSAEALEVFPDCSVPTATAEAILAMKVLSATPRRPRDSGDIRAILVAEPELDETVLRDLLSKIEDRGYAQGQRLVEKWQRLRKKLT